MDVYSPYFVGGFVQDRKMSWRTTCAVLVVGMGLAGAASAQTFELVGGGAFGDNGAALQANLADATDVVYDAAGNLYVSQRNANRIRRIAPNGTITTIAGGNTGFAGDGGPASAALISRPAGLAIDGAGNLYFADSGNRRIRRITPAGIIGTVAGNGGRGHAGDGGSALAASFASISGLAVDSSGNLYVSDTPAQRVRRITPAGLISTVAGNGEAGYSGDNGPGASAQLNTPSGLDTDSAGNLYIADSLNQAVRRVTPAGVISTVWQVGQRFPTNVKTHGNALYITDATNCAVYLYNLGNSSIVAGGSCGVPNEGGNATASALGGPDGVAVDSLGQVVFVDTDFSRVRRVTTANILQTIAGVGGSFPNGRAAVGAPLGNGYGIWADASGNVNFADAGYNRVRRINATGTIETLAGMDGVWLGQPGCAGGATSCAGATMVLGAPSGIAPGTAAGEVIFSDRVSDLIFSRNASGTVTKIVGGGGLAIGADGPADQVRIDPYGVARAPSGALFFTDYRAHKVRQLRDGNVSTYVGFGQAASTGDGQKAWFANVNRPMALAITADGTLYVSEGDGRRVRRVAPDGTIGTFAGNGQLGASGDGGAATSAAVGTVTGIAVHGGDVYLASEGLLRRVRNGIITSVPGWTQYAVGLGVTNGKLYVTTQQGTVYRATLAGAVASDYDGDGRSDVLWRNTSTGANTIWKAANGATTQTVTGVTSQAWKIVGQGDFDGDGKDDIFWRNTQTGANTVWRSGNGATPIATTGVTDLAWTVVGVGDFNKDGRSDVVWRHKANGKNVIWTSMAGANIPVTTAADQKWQIVGVGDFDGDGGADLFWRNATTGANQVWRNGNSAAQLVVSAAPAAWKLQGVGDFDGDGRSDLFWRNASTGQDVIWNRGNSATPRVLTTVTDLKWKVVAVGDYNGDGKADLLWRHATNGANTIWKSGNGATLQTVTGVTNTAWTIVPYEFQP